MDKKTDIIIVDDHALFLEGVASLLAEVDNINIKDTFRDGAEVINFLKNDTAEILITDISMPNMDGNLLTEQVKKDYPEIKIIVLTMHNNNKVISDLLKKGAEGFVLKNTQRDELIKAIQAVLSGETYFSDEVKATVMESMMKSKRGKAYGTEVKLSSREKEVLKLIAEEFTTNEIAEKLFISQNTVETHRKNILRKLNARNTAGLIKHALKEGWID